MAEIGITAFRASASAVIESVEAGTAWVDTRRGRPAALLVPIYEAEDIVLARADAYLCMRSRGRTSYARGRTIALNELD